MISHHSHELLGAPWCLSALSAPEQAQHSQQLLVLGTPQILSYHQHSIPSSGPSWWAQDGGTAQLLMSQGHPRGSRGSGDVLQLVVPTTGTLSAPVALLHCSRDKVTNLIILTSILSPSSLEFTSSMYALMEEQPAFL